MERFNEEIIYVKTRCISILCLTKVKIAINKRKSLCRGCTFFQSSTDCPNTRYGTCFRNNQIFKLYE